MSLDARELAYLTHRIRALEDLVEKIATCGTCAHEDAPGGPGTRCADCLAENLRIKWEPKE